MNSRIVSTIFLMVFLTGFSSAAELTTPEEKEVITTPELPEKKSSKGKGFTIRVLLDEPIAANGRWDISSSEGIIIASVEYPEEKRSTKKPLCIEIRDHALFMNTKKQATTSFYCKARGKQGSLIFKGKAYNGTFLLVQQNGLFYLMNLISSEDYVSSVLHKESWPGWPDEFNKALAVSCRTYALEKVLKARHKRKKGTAKVPYDIKNTNIHQTYQGIHSNTKLTQAVADTSGIIIAYQGQPIEAMFDACCGGNIPAKMMGIDFKKAPYLARTTACTTCKKCPNYRWSTTYSAAELKTLFKEEMDTLEKIKSISIYKKDAAGYVQALHLTGKHKQVIVSGKRLYSVLKKIKSMRFTISQKGSQFTFTGSGYGHGLGLCQWGARGMVEKGKKYTKILSFYYPHTSLMRVS